MGNASLKILPVAKELGQVVLVPPFDLGGNKLSGVATGTANTDAVNKLQMDTALGDYSESDHNHDTSYVPLTEDNCIVIEIDGTNTGGAIQADDFGLGKAPYACTIKKATLITREASSSLVVDILVGGTLATVASITGTGTKPTLASAQEVSESTFTDWGSLDVAAGQLIQAKATGTPATALKAWLMLEIERDTA